MERGCAVWHLECDALGGLPQATWVKGAGEVDGIYMQLSHLVRDFKLKDP